MGIGAMYTDNQRNLTTEPLQSQADPSPHSYPVGRVIAVSGSKLQGILLPYKGDSGAAAVTPDVRLGAIIKVETPHSSVFGVVGQLTVADPAADAFDSVRRQFDIELLGEIPRRDPNGVERSFNRGVAVYPVLDDDIYLATPDERSRIYARPDKANVRIGTLHPDNDLPAYISTDDLLGKHFAILGSTGSGKSCSAALILRSILADHPNGHVILLDPHNEYFQSFGDTADVVSPDKLEMPYWLLNFEEIVEVIVGRGRPDSEVQMSILKEAIVHAKKKFAGDKAKTEHITVDTPIPYVLSELIAHIGGQMGQFENPESSAPFLRLKSRLESLRSDRRYAFMFSGLVVQDVLPDILSRILSIPVQQKPITILDLSGVPSEIVDVVVSVLCRIIFDFALWSVPAQALPVLLVCEEAHRYVPADSQDGFGPTKKAISRIAMEGRKYGVSLCLISQRPSELSPNILSQCNTMFALRMSNERDQEIARRALPESAMGLLNALPALRTQEAVVCGEGVSMPIRLRFADLDPNFRPKSGNADFSVRWQREDQGREFINSTVERWRSQFRSEDSPQLQRPVAPQPQQAAAPQAAAPQAAQPTPQQPAAPQLRK
jgi:DNA helicase HerA-like ATPase